MQNKIAIDNLVRSLILETQVSLDDEHTREDLMGLYTDIRAELRLKAPEKEKTIYTYAALLQDELDIYSPYSAYEAGATLGCYLNACAASKEHAFMSYMHRIEVSPDSKSIHNEVNNMFNDIHTLLGDARSLINEFTDLYRKCNGIVCKNINLFFDMGYSEFDMQGKKQ